MARGWPKITAGWGRAMISILTPYFMGGRYTPLTAKPGAKRSADSEKQVITTRSTDGYDFCMVFLFENRRDIYSNVVKRKHLNGKSIDKYGLNVRSNTLNSVKIAFSTRMNSIA